MYFRFIENKGSTMKFPHSILQRIYFKKLRVKEINLFTTFVVNIKDLFDLFVKFVKIITNKIRNNGRNYSIIVYASNVAF